MTPRLFLALAVTTALLPAAEVRTSERYEDRAALVVSNDRLELTVLELGGPLARIVLTGDGEKLNPLWNSFEDDRNNSRPLRQTGAVGHFVCVDGFGPTSEEESAAGLSGHGEAHRLPWKTVEAKAGDEAVLVQQVELPIVQEKLTRTISLREGENVVRVSSQLESLLGFDRPVNWAEHATIGSPFLEPGVTVVDLSGNRAMVRPRPEESNSRRGRQHRLAGGEEFEWPMGPLGAGGQVNLRAAPDNPDSLDHTGHLMTPSGSHAWVTALHPEKRLLLGYIFNTDQFPWLQIWEHYPPEGMRARGLEFGTQAFDRPRREMVTQNRLFGELLYRWLPAKSTIQSTFLVFWTQTPEGFQGVDEIRLDEEGLTLEDSRSKQTLRLETKQKL